MTASFEKLQSFYEAKLEEEKQISQELREEIHRLSFRYPRFGYRKIHDKLKEADWKVGRERVRLIRKQEGLQVIKKQKKKRKKRSSKIQKYFLGLILVSCSAQLGVMPLSLYYFKQFSGLFLISSLLLLPD